MELEEVEELYLLRRSELAWTQCYVGAEVAVSSAPVLPQGLANSCTRPSRPASSVVLLLHSSKTGGGFIG